MGSAGRRNAGGVRGTARQTDEQRVLGEEAAHRRQLIQAVSATLIPAADRAAGCVRHWRYPDLERAKWPGLLSSSVVEKYTSHRAGLFNRERETLRQEAPFSVDMGNVTEGAAPRRTARRPVPRPANWRYWTRKAWT